MIRNFFSFLSLLFLIYFIVLPNSIQAQRGFEVTPFIGYQFSGSAPAYYGSGAYTNGHLDIKDSEDFGLVIDIPLPFRDGVELELMFLYMDTKLQVDKYSYGVVVESETFQTIVEYYQIGGVNVMDIPGSKVKPFGALTLGAARFNPKGSTRGDEWFFAGTLGAGAKIMASERIGIRLQGRLLLPFQFGSAGLWCGTGSGCSVGVGSTSVFLQGDFTAGLIIRL
jgi:hypothetical protein